MALRLQVYHLGSLASPHVGFLFSNRSIEARETQDTLSSPLVKRANMPAVQWSQSPGGAPKISSVTSLGSLHFQIPRGQQYKVSYFVMHIPVFTVILFLLQTH